MTDSKIDFKRLNEDLSRCVHCGFCLQACPTYLELGTETDSPRGRIALIDALASNRAQPTESLVKHLDLCLQCRACETACPSGVQYGRIMEQGRALVADSDARPRAWIARIAAMRAILPHQRRVGALITALRLYQRTPMRNLLRSSKLLEILPGGLAAAESGLPTIPKHAFSLPPQPEGMSRTVALLTGCVMPHVYPRTHYATVRVLNRLGYRAVVPKEQTCCGALNAHAGDRAFARTLARRNIDAFLDAGIEVIIANSAGCGSTMKEYDDLLADDPTYRDRSRAFVAKTKDVLEFVADHDLADLKPVEGTVTYQDSCHLVHGQKVRTAPREIMADIPSLKLREMGAPDRCCGSAGVYSIVQQHMSNRLLSNKMDDIESTGANTIATANPGCMVQLEAGVRQRNLEARVVHVIELLDQAMRA